MSDLNQVESFWSKVCFDREFQPQGRFQVYRELVTERFVDVLHSVCPVAKSILSEGEWWDLVWDFLKHQPIQNVILRELPWEVSQYLKSHSHPLQGKYPYLGELIEYEFLELRAVFAPEDTGETPAGKVRLNPAHSLAKYRWPVHFISEELSDPEKIPQGEFHLLIWRDPESLDVEFMELNPLSAALIEILKGESASEKALLEKLAKEQEIPVSQEYLSEGATLIAELREKKILLSN